MVGAALGAFASIAGTYLNNKLAGERAQEDRKQNYMYNEMAANMADERTRALYNDFYSPAALVRQYKEAGLSPAMMFGGTPGQGGIAGAQGSGSQGLQTQYYPINMLEAAQIGNIMAQTKKTEAETETIKGENERGKAEIDNIIANTKSTELTARYTEVQTAIANIEKTIKEATSENIIEMTKEQLKNLSESTKKLQEEIRQLRAQNKITEESADAIIQYNKDQVTSQLADIALKYAQTAKTRSDIQLNQAQIKSLLNHIAYENRDIEIKQGDLDLRRDQLKAQIRQWAKQNLGDAVKNYNDIIEFWAEFLKPEKKQGGGGDLLPLLFLLFR